MYPWHDTFHMGLIHFMAYPNATKDEEVLATVDKVLRDEFFQAIEVSGNLSEELFKEIGKRCEIARVELFVAGQPVVLAKKLNLNSFDEDERRYAIEECKKLIDKGYISGAKAVAVLSGKDVYSLEREKAKELLVSSLIELCEYAEERGHKFGYTMGISLEVFDNLIDKKALIGPAPEAFDIASSIYKVCRNFGLMVDLSHQPLIFEDSFYTLNLLSPFITHIHIGNAVLKEGHPLYGDLHPRFGISEGENDVEEVVYFLKSLIHIGYFKKRVVAERPIISFEVKPYNDEDPDLVVANAKRTFLIAWNRIFPIKF
ncbi:MAG: sugar phosphate isomerase/epimerase [Dictyoglomaceae bacterium]|nr:sugar phosphate isomerase/epimerase [Dictyoglomaceae bacterium]